MVESKSLQDIEKELKILGKRSYFVSGLQLSNISWDHYVKFKPKKKNPKILGKVGEFLYNKLNDIKGIAEARITPRCLTVWIKRDFKWTQIDEEIEKALQETLLLAKTVNH